MELREIGKLVLAVLICQLAGIIGSVFTMDAIPGWYATLARPEFSPPNWVFAPVWISLSTLMGISLYLVWNKSRGKRISNTNYDTWGKFIDRTRENAKERISFIGKENDYESTLGDFGVRKYEENIEGVDPQLKNNSDLV